MAAQSELPAMLPAIAPAQEPEPLPTLPGAARVVRPVRDQVEFTPRSLEDMVADEHPARAIWALVERLDLRSCYAEIRAVSDGPGRPASDPRVLLALWILATVEGIGSARKLAALCEQHDAYRWLRGGVPVNYHLLADFRVAHEAKLDDLLTQTVAVLLHGELVTLRRVAQDGMRVRASAGASSFRRAASLERCLEEARAQVARLAVEREHPDPRVTAREQAARERAARERLARVEAALEELPQVAAIKERQRKKLAKGKREQVSEPRVSTTDPEARVMKLADGGFRPAFNVQLATDRDSRAIVAVAVSQQGADAGLAAPLEQQVVERTGQHPTDYWIDGGLAARADLSSLAEHGVTVYAPVEPPRTKTSGRAAYDPRPDDSAAVAAWRQRMGTAEAQGIYKERGSTAEWTNAQWRGRHGLEQFTVRGTAKVLSVVLLLAITHNLLRWWALT
jgi:transposase